MKHNFFALQVKKIILSIGFSVFLLLFSPAPLLFAQSDSVSGTACQTPGQVSQVCTGTRDYQIFECKIAAEDDCQGLLDEKKKLAASCDDCVPAVVGWLMETCEGRESQRTAAEFEAQCTSPLKQLDEEYSKCRNTYAWKATGKGSCSVEGMVCSARTSAGRRFDICSPGPDAYKDTEESPTGQAKPEEQKPPSGPAQAINDWIMENLGDFEPTVVTGKTELQNREQQIKEGQSQSDSVIHKIVESQLAAGATISNYNDGVMIENRSDGSWIYISPAGIVLYSPQQGRRLYLVQKGEIEVDTKGSTIDVETPGAKVRSKGTHYWVSYDPDNKETVVGVYEGEVEVKTKDGKTTTVTPSGDKPGVVVVSKKLSVTKLAIFGLVLAAVLGAVVLLIKRRHRLSKNRSR